MKITIALLTFTVFSVIPFRISAQTSRANAPFHKPVEENLYIDVHQLEPGKVKYENIAKDLAVEKK